MRTTGDHGIEVRAGKSRSPATPGDDMSPDPMLDPLPDPLMRAGPPPTDARASQSRWWVAAAAGFAIVLVALAAAFVLARGADEDVVTGAAPAAVQPLPPALALTVTAPSRVVAGEVARFSATWSDGSGTFSGSTEDWGDEMATSSRKQGVCTPGETAPPAADGTYEVGHVWTAPGTYTVVLGVASYVCADGAAVVEEATETLTVTVLAAGER